jgi:hypothetical protein
LWLWCTTTNPSARANLLAAVNNWALELGECSQYADAVELLAHGRRFAPDHPTFSINHVALHERWVRSLCQRGEWAQAETVLERAAAAHPSHAALAGLKAQMAEQRAWHAQLPQSAPLPPAEAPSE